MEGLGLRWDTSNTPSATVRDLHFKGLTITEAVNKSRNELVIEHPANHPISVITGLQARLDTIAHLYDGISGISLGSSALGATQRIACYETATGTYMYGIGLFDTPGVIAGVGIWGGTGASQPDQTGSSGGINPHFLVTYTGRVGIGVINPSAALDVSGDVVVSGSITGATKSFDIEENKDFV